MDDQGLNPGSFVENGILYGLCKKLSSNEIKNIGVTNIPQHIAKDNPFLASVREYRVTDFKAVMCSNVYTSFESLSAPHNVIVNDLMEVVDMAKSCVECLKSTTCTYNKIDDQCGNCQTKGTRCISLVVFHVLWDMAPSQKKAANTITKIDLFSSRSDCSIVHSWFWWTSPLHRRY